MKTLTKARLFMWASIYAAIFVVLALIFPRVVLLTLLNGIFLGIVVAVAIVYAPLLWLTIRRNSVDRVSQLALAISLIWISVAGQKLYWLIWQGNGMPVEWRSNQFLALFTFLSIIGGGLFVSAPGYPSEDNHSLAEFWGANRNLLLVLGTIGGVTTCAISLYTGNLL
jgi:hypothetical protein